MGDDSQLSRDELVLASNALNEVCNGVHIPDWELQTRLGVTKEEARKLMAKIAKIVGVLN